MRSIMQIRLLIAALIIMALFATSTWAADSWAINWWSVDGGGGMSSGGSWTLVGSIGQPDAGVAQGGAFRLEGGFLASTATRSYQVNLPLVVR